MASPALTAAGPNGEYKFVSASGFLTVAGETLEVTEDMIQEITALENGTVTLKKNRLQLNRRAALKAIQRLEEQLRKQVGIKFETSLSGPTHMQFHKAGRFWVGSTAGPVVLAFEATYRGQTISGNLKTRFRAKVKGTTLTLTAPITGNVAGYRAKGEIIMVCERLIPNNE